MKKIGVKVSDIMTKKPVIVSPDTNLPSCARKMLSKNVGGIIVKENYLLLGIVTEKDIVEEAVGKELNIKKTRVKDIMTTGMITIHPNADLAEAVNLMIREDVRRLPVTENKKLVGLLTVKDILKAQPKLYQRFYDCLVLRKMKKVSRKKT